MRLPKMKWNTLFVLYCALILPPSCLQFDIVNNENVRQNLEYMCPGVNICDKDVSDMEPKAIDSNGYVSCCKGCSCHDDCHLRLNCCFPKDNINRTIDTDDVTPENEMEANHIGKSSDKIVLPSLIEDGNRTENIHTHRDKTTPNNDGLSLMQCRYARTGDPDKFWIGSEPAYRMITKPPLGGCKADHECQRLVHRGIQATCDDDVSFPWGGDLYPVYSYTRQLIYKNELCACCHGVSEYRHWTAQVVCNRYKMNGNVPINEYFNFLQATNNSPSNHCFLSFHFDNIIALLQNMCFMATIDECNNSTVSSFKVPKGVTMTRHEIVEACLNGPKSPFLYNSRISFAFKNVFCAMCNLNLRTDMLKCVAVLGFNSHKSDESKFIYLLDTTSVPDPSSVGKSDEPVPYPTACSKNNNKWVENSCRVVKCPSGQIRNTKGMCIFPSSRWLHRMYEMSVELEYVDNGESVLTMLNKGVVTLKDVDDAFMKANPWPSNWTISTFHHSAMEYPFPPRIAMYLAVHTSQPETMAAQILASMTLQWNVLLDGKYIVFSQSFLKYDILRGFREPMQGDWIHYVDDIPKINILENERNVTWKELLNRMDTLDEYPILLNKLVTCEQIELLEGEFIDIEGMILLNRLTNKTMFDQEFDILDINGRITPRVCLSDTTLVPRVDKSGAQTLYFSTALQILVTVLWKRF